VLPFAGSGRFATIAVLAMALGVQNSTVRHLGAADLTTTVLTLTLTGISADSTAAGGKGSRIGRRLVTVASMFLGALSGVLLIHAGDGPEVLLAATGLLLATVIAAAFTARTTAAWA
jgi:uncharacterized membrane protein YoaK (UPF0700 family)